MRFRLTSITTKSGDKGTTKLGSGDRVSKGSNHVMAIGGIDELNTAIGMLRLTIEDDAILQNLITIQHQLLVAGSQIAGAGRSSLKERHVEFLEAWQAELIAELDPVQDFVLPGGTVPATYCHNARVTCRRTERYVVAAELDETLGELPVRFLNRLSDLLFVLARVINKRTGYEEIVLNREI